MKKFLDLFIKGIASFNIYGEPPPLKTFLKNDPKDGFIADAEAIMSDWKTVGKDMETAIEQFKKDKLGDDNEKNTN